MGSIVNLYPELVGNEKMVSTCTCVPIDIIFSTYCRCNYPSSKDGVYLVDSHQIPIGNGQT